MNKSTCYVIGVDSSTTACKAIVWDRHGNVISEGRSQIPILTPKPAWHEQSALDWWDAITGALKQACKDIDPDRLRAICITPQRETFVPLAKNGKPLRNGILWMDERCRDLLASLEAVFVKESFQRITGKPLSVNLSIGKIAWLQQNEPDIFSQAAYYLDVHAYLVHRLTGNYATGWGCADPTGMFDMTLHDWSSPLIEKVGVHKSQLPKVFPPGAVLGYVSSSAARECGIPTGLPVIAGIGDGQMSGLGVNISQPGDAYLALGTSVVSGAFSVDYVIHPTFRTMEGGIPETYILETALMGGGYTLKWFFENIAHSGIDYERQASELPPGSQGLILVPYWNSVLGPYWDAAASGIVVGWRGFHTPVHLYRAILEGVAFEQRLCTARVEQTVGYDIKRYIVVGGGARSSLWCQIIADITGKQVILANTTEASALGAGMLAAYGAGWFANIEQASQAMSQLKPGAIQPDPDRHDRYTQLFEEVYCHLYPALQPFIDRIPGLIG